MGFFLPRKFLSDSINTTLSDSDPCLYDCTGSETCFLSCLKFCPEILCKQAYGGDDYVSLPSSPHHHDKIKRISIISISVISSIFFLVFLLTVYIKSRKRARGRRSREPTNVDVFLDEDHGPVVDHPIWHIRTVGLNLSVISSIPVCRYKSGDGLVEGADCSVCLSQFEEDETLRLLPKCNHAFHVNCIDTWLRSHTNCPLCRAPIVANSAEQASSSSSGVGIRIREETELEIQQEDQESGNVNGEGQDQSGDGMQRVRRSVSMDSLSASKISQAVLDRNRSGFGSNRTKEPNQRTPRLGRSSSVAGRRSFLKRSVSCSGKFLLPR